MIESRIMPLPTPLDPQLARQFAVEVVATLRAAGQHALWAGGCVRDHLLGLTPKDYDVATAAPPDRVREIFGRRRTIPVGEAFGVITVLGPRGAGQIEVATFRRDATYSDGRHPDAVTFSSAEEDAQRRDFTINGLFFDPLAEQVIDYVGGQSDLREGVIRAIGDAQLRFEEDKLRMLRGVRFAATFDFRIDPATLTAIRTQARELTIVSAERIAGEMRRMLTLPRRAQALRLLREAWLLDIVLPESAKLVDPRRTDDAGIAPEWETTLRLLGQGSPPSFVTALAMVLRGLRPAEIPAREFAAAIAHRWRLANDERDDVAWLLEQEELVCHADQRPWPTVQRVLAAHRCEALLDFADRVARDQPSWQAGIAFCRGQIARPEADWNPPPLITGAELIEIGLRPGPLFREILDRVRDAQLDRLVTSHAEAIGLARTYAQRAGG
jgi:tRNA nucleotidyltransferase/poly(A) polymerase